MLNKTCNVEKSSSDSSFINCRRGFARPPNSLRYYGPLIHFPQRKMPTSFDSSQRDLHEKFIKIGIAVPNKSWVAIFAVVEELTSLPWTRLKSTWSHGTKPNFWRLNPEKNHHLRKPLHRSSVENNGEKNQKWLHRTVMKSNANSIKPNETINFKGLDLQKKKQILCFRHHRDDRRVHGVGGVVLPVTRPASAATRAAAAAAMRPTIDFMVHSRRPASICVATPASPCGPTAAVASFRRRRRRRCRRPWGKRNFFVVHFTGRRYRNATHQQRHSIGSVYFHSIDDVGQRAVCLFFFFNVQIDESTLKKKRQVDSNCWRPLLEKLKLRSLFFLFSLIFHVQRIPLKNDWIYNDFIKKSSIISTERLNFDHPHTIYQRTGKKLLDKIRY